MGITYRRFALLAAMASSLVACTPKPPNQFRLPNIPGSWRTQGALAGELGSIMRVQTSGHGTTISLVKTAADCGIDVELFKPTKAEKEQNTQLDENPNPESGKSHLRRLRVEPDLDAAVGWNEVKELLLRGSYRAGFGTGLSGRNVRSNVRNLEFKARAYSISVEEAVSRMNSDCIDLLLRKSGDKNPFRLVTGVLALSNLEGEERSSASSRAKGKTPAVTWTVKANTRYTNEVDTDYLYSDHVAGLKLAMTCEGALVKQDLSAHMVEDRWGWNGRRDCNALQR